MKFETKRKVLHFFFPTRCPVCGEVIYALDRFCKNCPETLTPYEGDFIPDHAAGFTAVYEYDENIRPAINLLKSGVCDNADYALGGELADALALNGTAEKIDVIVPVPMYKKQLRKRTYNQSLLIADVISRQLDIPVDRDSVVKVRETTSQKTLGKADRKNNLKDAFAVSFPDKIKDRKILLVDDICTTGSTFEELVKVLLESGAAEVYCASACKTPLKNK